MIIQEELYDALKAGNVPEEQARNAAREVAKHTRDLQDIRGELKLLRWMLVANLAMNLIIFFKVFSH